ncbi:MAG: 6-phosphogluconolactonase [Patescibacteria group bacterium]
MQTILKQSPESALTAAGEQFNSALSAEAGKPLLILLSGGSALKLTDSIPESALTKQTTIGILDERYSTDPEVNTFAQFKKTDAYQLCIAKKCTVINSLPEDESQEDMAERIDKQLHDWAFMNPQGAVIITQGIGADGHTAGIMPYPEDSDGFYKRFDNPEKWIVGYDAGDKNQFPHRITVSLAFLRSMVTTSIVYAVGMEKRQALSSMMTNGTLADVPARILRQMPDVYLFTDISLNP